MLPVPYVPPVTPPSPLDRPPSRRRPRTVLLLAAVFVATPLAAIAVLRDAGTATPRKPSTETAAVAEVAPPPAKTTVAEAEKTDAPAPPPGPLRGPATSGGAQPYVTGQGTSAADPTATADRSGVRVIDLSKKAAETGEPVPAAATPAPPRPATTTKAEPARPAPAAEEAKPAAPTAAESPAVDTAAVPLPRPRPNIPSVAATATAAPQTEAQNFAARLEALRRGDVRPPSSMEAAPPEDDEEVVVVPRRRHWSAWSWVPFVGDPGPRPTLRTYPTQPSRVARDERVDDSCHWHAWPVEGMAFHREIRCHWHDDPNDPSIRYVR